MYSPHASASVPLGRLVSVIAAALLLLVPGVSTARAAGGAAAKAQEIIVPKLEFRDATLREATDFLRKKAQELDPEKKGVNLILAIPSTLDARISLRLQGVPLLEVARYVALLGNLDLSADAYALTLRPRTVKVAGPLPGGRAATATQAERIVVPKLEWREASATEAVDFLRRKALELDPAKRGVNIVIQHSPTSVKARVTLSLSGIPLSEVLKYIGDLVGLVVTYEAHAVVLRPPPGGEIFVSSGIPPAGEPAGAPQPLPGGAPAAAPAPGR